MPTGIPFTGCRGCGKPKTADDPLSRTGLCPDCVTARIYANARQLVAHRGPYFDHWRRRCLAAFGVTLPDDG